MSTTEGGDTVELQTHTGLKLKRKVSFTPGLTDINKTRKHIVIKQGSKFRLTDFNNPKSLFSKCLKMNDDYTACSKLKDSDLKGGEDVMKEDIPSVEDKLEVEDGLKEEDESEKKDGSEEEYMPEKEDIMKEEDTMKEEDMASEDKAEFKIKSNGLPLWGETQNDSINFSAIKRPFCYNEDEIINSLLQGDNEENSINVEMEVTIGNQQKRFNIEAQKAHKDEENEIQKMKEAKQKL